MKDDKITTVLVIIVLVVALATVGLVIYRLDLDKLYTLALILVGGVVLAVIIAATALPIRARKVREGPHERETVIKHTIEREGRIPEQPKIYALPQGQQTGWGGAIPDLLRSAYMAGQRGLPGTGETGVVDAEFKDVTQEWNGEIKK